MERVCWDNPLLYNWGRRVVAIATSAPPASPPIPKKLSDSLLLTKEYLTGDLTSSSTLASAMSCSVPLPPAIF